MQSTAMDAPTARQKASPQQAAELARAYGRMVFSAAYQVLGDHAQAEDVQQDVFLRVMQRPMTPVDSWPALLKTLAVRMAIDQLRRSTRWQRLLPVWMSGSDGVAEQGADHHAERSQQAARLRRALTRLPVREAECFALRCLHGMDVADIARSTGMTANHVSVSLHRATRKLESSLGTTTPTTEENA
jgi:RNA polymerase sigma-70 factor (ECF subfamily)